MKNRLISTLFLLALIVSLSFTVLSINIEPVQSSTPNCIVSGHVYSTTGNPVPSALTYLIDTATGHGVANCYSDFSGFYYLTVPAGTYIIVSYISGTAQIYSKQDIVITGDNTIDIHLIVGLKVSGHVMDSSGNPVVGAQTSMHNSAWTVPSANTDAYGNFTVYAPAGTYSLILWPPTNSRLINYENNSFTVNSETSCNITMPSGYKVSGYIRYPSGEAVSSVSTALIDSSGFAYSSGYWSDPTGFYSLCVPSGTYSLRAKVNNFAVNYYEPNIVVNSDITKNIQLITTAVSPTSAIIDAGQSYPFIATAQGGSGTYTTYVWYVNGAAKSATHNSTFNFIPDTAGTYTIGVTVQDSWSASSTQSTTASATVNSALTMPAPSTSAGAIDQGQTCQLSSIEASTGTAPYTYQWCSKAPDASNFSAISDATALGYTFSTSNTTAIGEWQFILNVTDSASKPNTASSNATSVFLTAPPSVTISPKSAVLDIASTQTFNAITSNGLGALTYRWFLDGVKVGGNNTSYPYVVTAGNHTLYCNVTDSANPPLTGTSNTVTITTNPALTAPVISSLNGTIDQGQRLWLNATAPTDGTPPYSYQWFAMDPSRNYSVIPGATSLNCQVATLSNMTAGNWSFVLHVTDSATMPVTTASNIITIAVNTAPSVIVSPGNAAFTIGQSNTFTATAAGGSGNYTEYQWYVNGVAQQGQNSATFSFSPSATGSYSVTAIVTDSLGATSNMSAVAQVQTSPVPTATPTQTPSPTAAPTVTPKPTAIPTPTPATIENPTTIPTSTSPTPTQNVTQGPDTRTYIIISIALAVFVVVLIGFILASKKIKKK